MPLKDEQQTSPESPAPTLKDLGLDDINWDAIGDPAPPTDEVASSIDNLPAPWEDAPPIPGDEGSSLPAFDLPGGDAAPDTSVISMLSEYLSPLRQASDTIQGMLGDYHKANRDRFESILATVKSLTDGVNNRIDTLEGQVQDLTSQFRTLIQALGDGGPQPPKSEPVVKEAKEKPPKKEPKAPARPTPEQVGTSLGIPRLGDMLATLKRMPDGKELTVAAFVGWLTNSCKVPADKANQVVEQLKLKGPITNKTF